MKMRLISSAVGLAVLAIVTSAYFTPVYNFVVAIVLGIALYEIYHCFGIKFMPVLIYEWALGLILVFSDINFVSQLVFPALFGFILLAALYMIIKPDDGDIHQLGGMIFYSTVIFFCFYPFIYFKEVFESLPNRSDAVYLMLLSMAIGWGADSFAFFVGSAVGKRKLAPKISPNKTVEGVIGGVFGSFLFVLILTFAYVNIVAFLGFETAIVINTQLFIVLLPISIVGTALGVIGDLFASVVKRQCQIKDFGSTFPGHGGVLDRFDSVLLIAPFLVIILKIVMYN